MSDKSEVMGTVFRVDGTWYIRHLHGGGNLIKLVAQVPFRDLLENGRLYQIDGYIGRNHLGCDEACYARNGVLVGIKPT